MSANVRTQKRFDVIIWLVVLGSCIHIQSVMIQFVISSYYGRWKGDDANVYIELRALLGVATLRVNAIVGRHCCATAPRTSSQIESATV